MDQHSSTLTALETPRPKPPHPRGDSIPGGLGACEILSRSTQAGDRVVKLPTYAGAGVGHVWMVAPAAETIEVYRCSGGQPTLVATAKGAVSRVLLPFDLPFDVGHLWAA